MLCNQMLCESIVIVRAILFMDNYIQSNPHNQVAYLHKSSSTFQTFHIIAKLMHLGEKHRFEVIFLTI